MIEEEQLYKRYVNVIAAMKTDGTMTPLYILWDTPKGQVKYRVQKVLSITRSVAAVGGAGVCYHVRVEGKERTHERNLFWEQDRRWFIESKKP